MVIKELVQHVQQILAALPTAKATVLATGGGMMLAVRYGGEIHYTKFTAPIGLAATTIAIEEMLTKAGREANIVYFSQNLA